MDIFTRNKFLLRIIFILIFLNLISTGYLLWNKKGGPNPRQPKRDKENSTQILKEKLHLTKEQESAIFKLREEFAQKEEALTLLIRSQRDSMNVVMFHADTDTASLKRIARRVAENEYQMELCRIEQSQQLKNICTEEQLKEFQHLVSNIRNFFQPDKKKE
ncbi:MAG: Spy/CpxP family protein refolding chaperone [Prolixibacteraceae bacterium]